MDCEGLTSLVGVTRFESVRGGEMEELVVTLPQKSVLCNNINVPA